MGSGSVWSDGFLQGWSFARPDLVAKQASPSKGSARKATMSSATALQEPIRPN